MQSQWDGSAGEWRATTNRGASDARLRRVRRRVVVVDRRSPDAPCASQGLSNLGDLRPTSPRRLDLRSASDARDTNTAYAAHECAPSGLHEYCATIYFNCRHMGNGFCGSIRGRAPAQNLLAHMEPYMWNRGDAAMPRFRAYKSRCTLRNIFSQMLVVYGSNK